MAFQGFGGFDQSQNNELTVDQLLNVAKMQGGAVAEVAEELSNPRRSIMATVGNGFKNAFTGFLDIIAMPGQVVAGTLSSDITVREALDKNISMSDIVFKDKDLSNASLMTKTADFISRTAVDVVFDPLTYVTFGASRGILGISSAPKAFAGEKTAKALGLKNVGDSFALNEFGEKFANDYVAAMQTGNRQGFFAASAKELAQKAGVKTDDELVSFYKNLRESFDEIEDSVTSQILGGRLRKTDAVNAMGKMIEKHPALIETLVDKGGLKFFGKSVLSSQRIRGSIAMIPGMTLLDDITLYHRNAVKSLFSRNYVFDPTAKAVGKSGRVIKTGGGRLPDEAIRIEQQFRDLEESLVSEAKTKIGNIFEGLGIDRDEAQLIRASIEYGMEPRDPRLAQVSNALRGIQQKGPIREEVMDAVGLTKDVLKNNREMLRKAGIPIHNYENYFPHILVKQDVPPLGFRTPPKKTANQAKFAKASVLVDDAGNRFPTWLDSKPKDGGVLEGTMIQNGEKVKKTFDVDGELLTDRVTGQALQRARATVEEARELGVEFADDALTGMLLGSMEASKVAVGRDFMREMAQKMGKVASEAPDGWRQVEATGIKFEGDDIARFITDGKGEPILFHPLVAQRIEKFSGSLAADEASAEFLKNYDKLQNLFKATVTSIFPAFHGRNAISNVLLNFLDIGAHALDPVKNVQTANMLNMNAKMGRLQKDMIKGVEGASKQYSDLMMKEVFTDNAGYRWTFGELRNVMHRNVVAFHPRNLGQIDQVQFAKEEAYEIVEKMWPTSRKDKLVGKFTKVNPFSTKNVAVQTGLKVGGLVEDYSRTMNFIANLKATGDPLLAAERTKMFLFDYQNLSNFERSFLRRIIPFYCVPEDTEALTKDGWKHHKDIKVGDLIMTINDVGEYEWQPMLEKFVAPYNDYLTSIKSKRYSLDATFNHRWVVEDYKGDRKIKKGFELNTGDKIITNGQYLSKDSKYTVDDARLLGWLLTDGYFRVRGNHVEAVIYQSPKKFLKEVIEVAGGAPRKPHPDTGVVCVPVLKERIERIKPFLLRSKKDDNWIDFILSLGREELEAMYDAMYKADGTTSTFRKQDFFACELDGVGESFQLLATLLGKRAIKSTKGYYVSKWNKLGVKDMWKEHYLYNGEVWCPRTENGTWVMRQRGFITPTGNTFTRKNLELQVKTLFKRPGAIAGEIRAVQSFGVLFDSGGEGLTDEEREALPEWVRGGINTVLSREGSHVSILSSLGSPIEQPFQQFQPNQLLASVSPILRVGPELMMNYSMFHGKPISEVTNAAAFKSFPEPIKDFIGFTEVKGTTKDGQEFTYYASMRPRNMHLIMNLPPTARIISEIKGLQKEDVSRSVKAWDFLVGFNPYNFDLELEAQRREDELRREMEDVLDRANVGYRMDRYVLPKEYREEASKF